MNPITFFMMVKYYKQLMNPFNIPLPTFGQDKPKFHVETK